MLRLLNMLVNSIFLKPTAKNKKKEEKEDVMINR
jgi:hypothetical protein